MINCDFFLSSTRETMKLSSDADSRTDTIFERWRDISPFFLDIFFFFWEVKCLFSTKKMRKITQPLKYYVGPTIRIGWDIHGLPYAGFFLLFLFTVYHHFTVFTGIFYCLQKLLTYLLGKKKIFFKTSYSTWGGGCWWFLSPNFLNL